MRDRSQKSEVRSRWSIVSGAVIRINAEAQRTRSAERGRQKSEVGSRRSEVGGGGWRGCGAFESGGGDVAAVGSWFRVSAVRFPVSALRWLARGFGQTR
jgi:hypothetical protein